MFVGHYGLALAAKRVAPRTSLGTLFLAAQLVDLVWPMLLIAGIERVRIVPNENPFLHVVEAIFFGVGGGIYGRVVRPADRTRSLCIPGARRNSRHHLLRERVFPATA